MKKITHEFYEVRTPDDMHGLCIRFDRSAKEALKEINDSYEYAKKRGYDNRNNKWIIVCHQSVKEFDDNGAFLKEESRRFVVGNVEFSVFQNAFVFVY